MSLENLGFLYEDMKQKLQITSGYYFSYRGKKYDVIVTRFIELKHINPYALVHLTIYKNFSNTAPLRTEANRARFLCSLKEIYNFFDISCEGDTDYSWLKAFYAQFNQYTPNHYFPSDEHLKQRQITVISALDPSDDPDKIYPFAIRRNSESQHRSSFNDQKAKLACPKLYKDILKNDHSLSLCFSKNPADEKDEQTIRHNFIENSR